MMLYKLLDYVTSKTFIKWYLTALFMLFLACKSVYTGYLGMTTQSFLENNKRGHVTLVEAVDSLEVYRLNSVWDPHWPKYYRFINGKLVKIDQGSNYFYGDDPDENINLKIKKIK